MVKPSAIMAIEGADDRHRDGGGRNEHRPETLQKYHDHDEDQNAGFEERLINGPDRPPDKLRGVVADGVLQTFGEILAHLRHGLVNMVGDVDGIGLGQGKDDDLGRAESADIGKVRIRLLAQINAGDIAQAYNLGSLAAVALDDDVFKLIDIGEPAQAVDGELKDLIAGHRRSAQLSCHDLDILVSDGVQDILRGEVEILEPLRVQPDPHAVGTGPENPDLTDAGQPGQGILHIDDAVVGEKGLIKPVVVGV